MNGTIRVPASSSNLGPGFDTLALALDLWLEVKVRADYPAGFSVTLEGEGHGILPEDGRNWVLKSAREIARDAVDRAAWHINSEIPVASGLGSSAAARVAGLAAGYWLRDGRLPPRHKIFEGAVQTEHHPDNAAAAVFGGFRIGGRDRNGDWNTWPGVVHERHLRLLLVIPKIPVPTHLARSILPTTYSRSASVRNLQSLGTLLSGLARGDWDAVRQGCRDHLHEPFRLPLVKGLKEALQFLRDHPHTGGAYLSGAGPALAAFLPEADQDRAVADEALEILKKHGTPAHTRVASVVESGLSVAG
ncbi:MAG: homoserine kinase [Planctomycetota bacterium]